MENELSQFEKDTIALSANTAEQHSVQEVAANDPKVFATHARVFHADDVDEHVDTFSTVIAAAVEPSLETPKLVAVWTAARPVLHLVEALLFFKPKWRKCLQGLILALDEAFPTAAAY